jgi:hypothetical protein
VQTRGEVSKFDCVKTSSSTVRSKNLIKCQDFTVVKSMEKKKCNISQSMIDFENFRSIKTL